MRLPKFNKKGQDVSEGILNIGRIIFLVVVLITLTLPIGCYSKNKQVQLDKINEYEADFLIFEVKSCLEKKGISEKPFKECFIRENVGVKITSPDSSFIINPEKFEEELCNLSRNIKCKKDTLIIKEEEKIRQVFVELVVNYE
ncbi:hypothetical protein J4449_02660 [Candidatus Woesearchaeota archaeon]|nr:hypothetical protein [Candidatus Woesearchaeota archaeon]